MRLRFVALGRPGDAYPVTLRVLRGVEASGVYVFRSATTGQVLYVGESHTGRLYSTITRHLQGWSRQKRFWDHAEFSKHDPGVTYRRSSVEAAWLVLASSKAVEAQNRLIRRLRPVDNIVEGSINAATWIPDVPLPF